MPEDHLTALLGDAIRDLVLFTENRPEDATPDDDVRALESFAQTMSQVHEDEKDRLRSLLGSEVYGLLGWDL